MNERLINAILSNPEDDLIYKKQQIEMYFAAHPDVTERAEYMKSAYQDRYTELLVGSGRTRVGYKPQEDGLLMWEGAYLSHSSESVFSWQLVAELTAQIIERGEYHINRDIKGLKFQDSQQMSLFDLDSPITEPVSAPAKPVSYGIRYSQQVIDEALCIGANDRNSRLIVCAYFMKDKPLEENARFLMRHYGTNGAGFYLNDRQYAIWYNTEGIRLSSGDSAQGGTAMLISWEDAAKRIRELLDLGRYMPQTELDRVQDYEYQQIAESLWYLRQDFDDGAKEQALLPTVNGAYMSHGGFPENTAQIAELLKQPYSLQTLVDELSTFLSAYEADRDILRFHFHRPREILLRLTDLQREPLIFTAAEGYDPQRRQFITMDEIDKLLRSGSIHYRLGVYSYYLEHPDIKERAKYLQSYHGDSGSYGGNDNTNYGSKGLSFSHGDILAPYAKLDWSWTKAARRIETLIHNGSFLSDEDRAAMPEYERRQLAIIIQGAFFDLPDSQPIPFSHNPIADYWKNVEEIQGQLTDPAKVEEIYQMLVSVADGTKPEERYYTSRQEALAAMLSYREGTYSLFGEKREPRQIAPAPLETKLEAEQAAEEEPSPFIQHFYVIPDLKVAGQLEVQTYSSFEEAFAAYTALPKDKLKALGVQNTMPLPGSLDFIQCREGVDTLVEDYLTAEGWDNPEISQLVDAIRSQINQLASEQEQPAAAPSDRIDEMLRQAIPENEIAYIHDANTEARKKELFAKVRAGQVRVLLGSTQKMGAGTNVQDRLVALHDLNCPWRPSDLAQRLGRIVRQGNQNPEVDIYRYVTENTFDAYLYQLVENKQKFIAQIMTSKSPVRVADDIDETALSYSEIKALATGNPLIIEKCNLDMEVAKLNVLKASHLSQKYALEEMVLRKYPQMIQDLKQRIFCYEQDTKLAELHPKPAEGFVGLTLMGKEIADKEAAGKAIIDVCTTMTGSGTAEMIGEYRGFFISIAYDGTKNEYQMRLKGTMTHTVVLGADVYGNITRMDNVIEGIAGKLKTASAELTETQVQMENAREEMKAPFAKEDELKEKEARLKELNILLNMDQKDRSLIDDAPEEDIPDKPRPRGIER